MIASLLAAAVLATPTPTPRSAALDRAVGLAAAQGLAGQVLVADRERVVYARSLSAPGRPHARDDLWRWASVTKQLTATLALQAVDEGKLTLDTPLSTALPAFKGPTASRITVRALLQHTSGLPNPDTTPAATADDFPAFYRRTGAGVGGTADALGFCAGAPRAEPGTGFSYDNCDYIVLGAVLERAQGRPFRRLVRERLAGPAGLRSLDVASGGSPAPRVTPGVDAKGAPEPPFALATFGAAGAAYGRPDDLVRFDQALLTGRLLSRPSTELAWAGDPKLGYVALGAWGFSAPLRGCGGAVRLVERRGEIGGVEVRNLLAPDLGRILVVFADRADLDFGEIWRGQGLTYELASAAFCPARE